MAARLFIQSDWVHALRKNEGEAWVSCKIPGKPTLYGSLKCQGVSPDGMPEVVASEGFVVNEVAKKSIHISCPEGNASSKFLAPYTTFARIHEKGITCVDISCGGGLGVSTSSDGTMKIWQTTNGETRRELVGHICDVNCCRFFPSGLVVLSGGMDTQVKIWSAQDGSCPVTLKGHRGGILDTAIVDRGRNVVSCSRDGTARLWDCGKSVCLGVIADCGSAINGVAVGVSDNTINLGSPEKIPSDREVGTEGKLLLLAREDKKLQAVGLQSRQPIFLFDGSDAFNCCTFLSSIHILAGTHDGNIYKLDVRNTKAPVQTFHRSGAPVFSLMPCRDGFIACQADGSFIIQQDLDHVIELTGPDCDTVYKAVVLEKSAYTCCRDGIVRKYLLSDL
ncbi:proteasomal ATPase-associated factor 1 isoform X2 [Latimeria chalumnae]|uniref:proteasomal ATPase-associated factor 1 isoform X2 n=1 Tax=Latimeria chalumnae TaxID=7897 RepID=UPI0006D8D95C|nr:PREDICTED: proteasomal ATPase-associated factor 1 [Latimeria chalumnae]|eukprot:XP_014349339.1 PREDICTED: proteasomal ATPase-associated factor 1 [Latimeria chalumnae]